MTTSTVFATMPASPARALDLDAAMLERAYVERYVDLYRYLLALTRDHSEAEDIASEAFTRVLNRMRDGRLAEADLIPWVFAIGRNLAVDRWRRARRLVHSWSGSPSLDTDLRRAEYLTWVAEISRCLTERQRDVVLLRYVHNLEDHEVAQVLGITESGVRSAAARAITTLREQKETLR